MKLSFHFQKGRASGYEELLLGDHWMNEDADIADIFDLITADGYATSAELTCANRCEAHFVSRQLFMVDVDRGMTIEELLNDPFYNKYSCGFYATPSFTWDDHRFRILFVTEQAITCAADARAIFTGLMTEYECADPSCKEATRLFYGSPNCEAKELRGDVVLPQQEVNNLITRSGTTTTPVGRSTFSGTASITSRLVTEDQVIDWIAKRLSKMKSGERFEHFRKIFGIIQHNWQALGPDAKAAVYSLYCTTDSDRQRQQDIFSALNGRF